MLQLRRVFGKDRKWARVMSIFASSQLWRAFCATSGPASDAIKRNVKMSVRQIVF